MLVTVVVVSASSFGVSRAIPRVATHESLVGQHMQQKAKAHTKEGAQSDKPIEAPCEAEARSVMARVNVLRYLPGFLKPRVCTQIFFGTHEVGQAGAGENAFYLS